MTTMSGIARGEKCSLAISRAPKVRSAVSDEANLGTSYHSVWETIINEPEKTWSANPRQFIDTCLRDAGLDPDDWRDRLLDLKPISAARGFRETHATARAEVAYELDPAAESARELGQGIGRKYTEAGGREGMLFGTADLVWTEGDPGTGEMTLVIRDHKTGALAKHTSPADTLQLAGLGLAAWLCFPPDSRTEYVRVELSFPHGDAERDAAQVYPGGYTVEPPGCVILAHTYDALDMEAVVLPRIAALWAARLDPRPTPGGHCTWCPLAGECPEADRALAEVERVNAPARQLDVMQTPKLVKASSLQTFSLATKGDAAASLQLVERAEAVVKAARERLKSYVAEHGPLDLGNGWQWGAYEQTRETIEGRDAAKMMEAILSRLPMAAEEQVRAIIGVSVTKEALERLASDVNGNKRAMPSIMTALREAGMVETSTRVVHEKRRAR